MTRPNWEDDEEAMRYVTIHRADGTIVSGPDPKLETVALGEADAVDADGEPDRPDAER